MQRDRGVVGVGVLLTRVLAVAHAMATNAGLAGVLFAVNYHCEGIRMAVCSRRVGVGGGEERRGVRMRMRWCLEKSDRDRSECECECVQCAVVVWCECVCACVSGLDGRQWRESELEPEPELESEGPV